jgi:hypothetical protein
MRTAPERAAPTCCGTILEVPVRGATYQPLDIAVAAEPEARPNGA